MTIQFLYFDECPNHQKAFNLLKETLREQSITAAIDRIAISDDGDAARQKFIGSPTIRVDGVDIETIEEDRPYAKTCRVYVVEGAMGGIPSKRMIRDALWRAVLEQAGV